MTLRPGDDLLNGRYRLLDAVVARDQVTESWVAVDEYHVKYLLKLWPFEGESPNDYQRALWDSELRTLYRASSSPGADDAILVLRDAGVDRAARCFVMVLEAVESQGYETLASALSERNRFPWLSNRSLEARHDLWLGLQRIADGLQLLHDQNVLHRNVGPHSVFFDPDVGVGSFRLGGFEWSLRLGVQVTTSPPTDWSSPPEFLSGQSSGYRPETDWYAFGMLATRCLLSLEQYAGNDPVQRHQRVVTQLQRATRELGDLERTLLYRLIASDDSRDRLTRSNEIQNTIRDIVSALAQGTGLLREDRPLVVAINPRASGELVDRAIQQGFEPNPQSGRAHESFNPLDPVHVANLTSFVQHDLAAAQLYAVPDQGFFLLNGEKLLLRIREFEWASRESFTTERTWDLAYCIGPGELRGNSGGSSCVSLPSDRVVVRSIETVYRDRTIRQNAQSWKRYLPSIERAVRLKANLAGC